MSLELDTPAGRAPLLAGLQRAVEDFEREVGKIGDDPASLALLYVDAWNEPHSMLDVTQCAVALERERVARERLAGRTYCGLPGLAFLTLWLDAHATNATPADRIAAIGAHVREVDDVGREIRRLRRDFPELGIPRPSDPR